jgi:enterochelin esterase-like enzyme
MIVARHDISRQPTLLLPTQRRVLPRISWPIVRTGAAIAVSTFICILLAQFGVAHAINDEMSTLGFDSDRALFLQYLLMALVGGLVAGIALRRRLVAWLGGLLYYVAGYLIPFIAQAQHPTATADGRPQLLIPGAFILNIGVLLSCGVIAAAAGAILGQAYGDILIAPLAILGRFTQERMKSPNTAHPADIPDLRRSVLPVLLMLVITLAIALAGANIGAILNYGAGATIYQPIAVAAERGELRTVAFRSPALGRRLRRFVLYLPPSYGDTPSQRYPVIYLLHGTPGSMIDWFVGAHVDMTVNDLVSSGRAREVILVSPDGNGPIYNVSEWANSADGRQQMENSIAHDLVAYVDAHYRTIASRAGRTLAGLSDGGFGATNIALHHSDVFGTVLTLGGFYQAEKSPVFGSGPMDDATHRYNSPADYIATAKGLDAARMIHFIVGVATHDRSRYRRAGMAFYTELKHLDAHVDLISVSGDHSWRTWGIQFAEELPRLEPPTATVSQSHRR